MISFYVCLKLIKIKLENFIWFLMKKKYLFTIRIPVHNHNKVSDIPIEKKRISCEKKSD